MIPDAASRLFATQAALDAKAYAAHAVAVFEHLAQHLSRLIGELGMRTLFGRSLSLASPAFPCLRAAVPTVMENPYETLRHCLELEPLEGARDASVHVFQTFVELLERFIGAGLVASLLHEVWPSIFPEVATKETK